MIFQHTWEQVLSGHKTQTRRPVMRSDNPVAEWDGTVVEVLGKRRRKTRNVYTKFAVGKQYPVQPGRGKKGVGRILITAIRRESIQDISDQDIIAEGFESREGFYETWQEMYAKRPYQGMRMEVWVLEFELTK